MSEVRVRELVHRYNAEPVLAIPELDVPGGRVHLAGANGAGKTTLLSILATLVKPTRGRVEVAGCDLSERARAARARVGYLGHEPSLHAALAAREALALHARLHEVPGEAVDEALATWGLGGKADTRVAELSFGQRRRLDLARALLHEPRVVLLDEPSTGLDREARQRLSEELEALDPELVLVASPDGPAVATDERLRLSGGEIVEAPT